MNGWKDLSANDSQDFINMVDNFLYCIYSTTIPNATTTQLLRVLFIIKNM